MRIGTDVEYEHPLVALWDERLARFIGLQRQRGSGGIIAVPIDNFRCIQVTVYKYFIPPNLRDYVKFREYLYIYRDAFESDMNWLRLVIPHAINALRLVPKKLSDFYLSELMRRYHSNDINKTYRFLIEILDFLKIVGILD